jgi:Leucine-rich repeat (LRR) protein
MKIQNFIKIFLLLFIQTIELNCNLILSNQILESWNLSYTTESFEATNISIVNIESDAFKHFNNLVKIDLSQNNLILIDKSPFFDLVNLKELNLSHNFLLGINSTSLKGLRNLETLDIGYNQLTVVDSVVFSGLINLKILYLNNNNLKVVPVFSINNQVLVANLQFLYLQNNKINYIPFNSLQNLKKLEHINLKNNQINDIQNSTTFDGLISIKELNLEKNSLNNFGEKVLSNVKIRKLCISDNPISILFPSFIKTLCSNCKINIFESC